MDIFSFSNHVYLSYPHYNCLYLNYCLGGRVGDFCKEEINATEEFLLQVREQSSQNRGDWPLPMLIKV